MWLQLQLQLQLELSRRQWYSDVAVPLKGSLPTDVLLVPCETRTWLEADDDLPHGGVLSGRESVGK
jgi:hypothetical protein